MFVLFKGGSFDHTQFVEFKIISQEFIDKQKYTLPIDVYGPGQFWTQTDKMAYWILSRLILATQNYESQIGFRSSTQKVL